MEPVFQNLGDEENLLPQNNQYRQAVRYVLQQFQEQTFVQKSISQVRKEKPSGKDWRAVKRIMRYLKTTKRSKLITMKMNSITKNLF